MRILAQRVKEAFVHIEEQEVARIAHGLVVLLGIEADDTGDDIQYLIQKLYQMRIFPDHEGKMNKSIADVDGHFLVVSQFTLHASTKKGNRPSFIRAARPEVAIPLYESFIDQLQKLTQKPIAVGVFGADMQVGLVNDGPVTIWMDSKNKE
jgi:D-aminoacyl-tRNA deacylase